MNSGNGSSPTSKIQNDPRIRALQTQLLKNSMGQSKQTGRPLKTKHFQMGSSIPGAGHFSPNSNGQLNQQFVHSSNERNENGWSKHKQQQQQLLSSLNQERNSGSGQLRIGNSGMGRNMVNMGFRSTGRPAMQKQTTHFNQNVLSADHDQGFLKSQPDHQLSPKRNRSFQLQINSQEGTAAAAIQNAFGPISHFQNSKIRAENGKENRTISPQNNYLEQKLNQMGLLNLHPKLVRYKNLNQENETEMGPQFPKSTKRDLSRQGNEESKRNKYGHQMVTSGGPATLEQPGKVTAMEFKVHKPSTLSLDLDKNESNGQHRLSPYGVPKNNYIFNTKNQNKSPSGSPSVSPKNKLAGVSAVTSHFSGVVSQPGKQERTVVTAAPLNARSQQNPSLTGTQLNNSLDSGNTNQQVNPLGFKDQQDDNELEDGSIESPRFYKSKNGKDMQDFSSTQAPKNNLPHLKSRRPITTTLASGQGTTTISANDQEQSQQRMQMFGANSHDSKQLLVTDVNRDSPDFQMAQTSAVHQQLLNNTRQQIPLNKLPLRQNQVDNQQSQKRILGDATRIGKEGVAPSVAVPSVTISQKTQSPPLVKQQRREDSENSRHGLTNHDQKSQQHSIPSPSQSAMNQIADMPPSQSPFLLDRPLSSTAEEMRLSHVQLPNFESTKYSVKENGVVKGYAANTNQGLVRDYNEDRVSIVLNMQKPPQKKCERWPKSSFFAIFDGHGGHTCADFLRDNLHQFIIRDPEFPANPRQAIINGFWKSEMYFLDTVEKFSAGRSNMLDRSGSCAIVCLFVDDICYTANVGDSRALMSCDGGSYTLQLSKDHKPNEKDEYQRIVSGGGKIYQTQSLVKVQQEGAKHGVMRDQIMLGPHRVYPGRLSVSRTFGDIEAKRPRYGGNPNVVVATPEIKCFKIEDNYDFIVLGCDGIFDKLENNQVIQAGWEGAKKKFIDRSQPIHQYCGFAVEAILKASIAERSMDNITVVMISFKNFRKALKSEIDQFNEDLQKQKEGKLEIRKKSSFSVIEDQNAAEQIDNKRVPGSMRDRNNKESGIIISKKLNLPNYDLSIEDAEIQPTLVSLARLQKRTTGSREVMVSPRTFLQHDLYNRRESSVPEERLKSLLPQSIQPLNENNQVKGSKKPVNLTKYQLQQVEQRSFSLRRASDTRYTQNLTALINHQTMGQDPLIIKSKLKSHRDKPISQINSRQKNLNSALGQNKQDPLVPYSEKPPNKDAKVSHNHLDEQKLQHQRITSIVSQSRAHRNRQNSLVPHNLGVPSPNAERQPGGLFAVNTQFQ